MDSQNDDHHHQNDKMKKRLTKQVSSCETPRDAAWERRRKQMLRQDRRRSNCDGDQVEAELLTDEDLSELRGCIELGFGFVEEEGSHALCETLPALDLYFAVNRQLSLSPASTPTGRASTSSSSSSSLGRSSPPTTPKAADSSEPTWKICTPGEDPQQVKTKLRHWAQAVACSVMQSL